MPLSKDEIKTRLKSLPGWKLDDDEIQRTFKFAGFKEAMLFVNQVARAAEAADHHPEIEIEYNRVKIELTTHSEGGVTEKDFALAERISVMPPDA